MEFSKYDIVKVLGSGSFGKVYRAIDRATDLDFVVKEVNLKQAEDEVEILRKLDHPNIVKFFNEELRGDSLLIFQEFCSKGDLVKFIKMRSEAFTENELWSLFRTLTDALAYIHSKGIVHLDIKCENIFVDSQNNLKIGDFGLSKRLPDIESDFSNNMQGSPHYQAPEIYNEDFINYKVDIWALGCVFYYLACFELPFCAEDVGEQKRIINETLQKDVPKYICN